MISIKAVKLIVYKANIENTFLFEFNSAFGIICLITLKRMTLNVKY